MIYEEFLHHIKNELHQFLGDGVDVELISVLKNNNVKLDGLVVSKHDINISPTIYLNSFYQQYEAGASMPELIREITALYETASFDHTLDIDFLKDFDSIKQSIACKLINFKDNQELLETVPHTLFLDLALVYYICIENEDFDKASILIHHNHLELWHTTQEVIHDLAISNTPAMYPCSITSIEELLKDIIPGGSVRESGMYVLTNAERLYGAVCMLYPNVLAEFAALLNSDLFILPSSIHEVILLSCRQPFIRQELSGIVKEINENEVEVSERLSNHIYHYSLKENQITL